MSEEPTGGAYAVSVRSAFVRLAALEAQYREATAAHAAGHAAREERLLMELEGLSSALRPFLRWTIRRCRACGTDQPFELSESHMMCVGCRAAGREMALRAERDDFQHLAKHYSDLMDKHVGRTRPADDDGSPCWGGRSAALWLIDVCDEVLRLRTERDQLARENDALRGRVAELESENARLRRLLGPLAVYARNAAGMCPPWPDSACVRSKFPGEPTLGDCRAALRALEGTPWKGD
jgi:hypothetical protein